MLAFRRHSQINPRAQSTGGRIYHFQKKTYPCRIDASCAKCGQHSVCRPITLGKSQAVSLPSTNGALRCLMSGIGQEPMFLTWCGHRH